MPAPTVLYVDTDAQGAFVPAAVAPFERATRGAAIGRLTDGGRPVDVLVLGVGAADALDLAQEVHGRDPDLAVVLLAAAESVEQLTKALRFAPFLGDDVVCVAAEDDGAITAAVDAAAARTRRRRELRAAAGHAPVATPAGTHVQAEQYLGHLLAHAPLGVVAADQDGGVIGWNARAEDLLGVREADVAGSPLCALFPDPERDRVDGFVRRASTSDGRAPSEVFERARGDGTPQFVEVTAIPVQGRGAEPGLLILLRDVTARVLAEEERNWMEEALRFQKTLLESQSEVSREAMLVVSREGRILSLNGRFCELWRIPDPGVGLRSAEEARRALEEEIAAPTDFSERIDRLATSVEPTPREDIVLADGRTFATYSGPVTTDEGTHYGRVWFFRDVTELSRVGAQLEARAREQAAVAWLGQRALAAKELDVLFAEAVAVIADTLRVEYAKVLELTPERDALLLRAGVGWRDGLVGNATVAAGLDSQAGYTLSADGPVVVEDLREEARFSGPALLRDHAVVSGMSVAIGGREPAFGVLGTHTTARREFTTDEVNFLRAIANVLSAAIERDDADHLRAALLASEQAARDRAEHASSVLAELQTVTDVGLAQLSLEELLGALQTTIARLLETDTVVILLLDEERNELVAHSSKGLEIEVELGVRIPVGRGFAGRIAASGEPLAVEDIAEFDIVNPLLREHGITSMLGVPLLVDGRATGVVHVGTRRRRIFSEDDVRLLQLVAARVALAIEHARLFEGERRARAEAQAAQNRLAFLGSATDVLTRSLDYEETLAAVARLALPELADWCIVDELREDGSVERVAVAASLPRKQDLLQALLREYPPTPGSPQPAAQALRSGETVVFDAFTPETLRETVRDERHWELLSELDPHAALAVPLVAHAETLGVITFAFAESRRRYGEAEIALAQELARRAALAVDRARLYRAEQEARREAERAQRRFAFLAEASELLSAELDYEQTLGQLAELVVPQLADWCIVYMVDDDGEIRRLALRHPDPEATEALAARLAGFSLDPNAEEGVPKVLRTGVPELRPEATSELLAADVVDRERFAEVLAPLGISSWMCVPLAARGRIVGAISFVSAESAHSYTADDLALAEELARRAAGAIDNARLYREAEERGNAARVLATIADGVFLVDSDGVVRLWNPAAEAITGVRASAVLGRRIDEEVPAWATIAERVPVAEWPAPASARAETLPLDVDGRELWLSVSGVGFEEGTVYAFRDLTEERRVEELKTEFVATASHELRTPLAAVYGAAMTLRRQDLTLDDERRELLLTIVAEEADRLSRTINDILWASRLEGGRLDLDAEPFDPVACAESVLDAARTHVPAKIRLDLVAADDLPPIVGDPDKFRQVLGNLVENAIKYSPDGGDVVVRVERQNGGVRFAVSDSGLGIPAREQARIFEKFYRLDPHLTRGVGGTGLGLYICRELVRHMNGRIWVSSEEGAGSTFFVELPVGDAHAATGAEAPAHA